MFSRKPPKPNVVEIVANPPVFNPNNQQTIDFALYRSDAIARCLEQRREEKQPLHSDHTHMVSEAMALAWTLVGSGVWTREQVIKLDKRLWGNKVD